MIVEPLRVNAVLLGNGRDYRQALSSLQAPPRSLACSIEQFVPIVATARFITGAADEPLDLLRVQPKCCSGAADHIFFHHHTAEIIRTIFERDLADLRALRYPG